MSDWLDKQPSNDIQTAIQSQAIQTSLEQNTSRITDAGFQSFLQGAPIPRIFLDIPGAGQALTTATVIPIIWGQASRTYDPYNMHQAVSTAQIVIPVDGMYTFWCNLQYTSNANVAAWTNETFFVSDLSKQYGAAFQLAHVTIPVPAGVVYSMTPVISMSRFFNATDSFHVNVFQSSTASPTLINTGTCVLGGCWTGPFKPYTTGSGGN